jgi:hypothetical protein
VHTGPLQNAGKLALGFGIFVAAVQEPPHESQVPCDTQQLSASLAVHARPEQLFEVSRTVPLPQDPEKQAQLCGVAQHNSSVQPAFGQNKDAALSLFILPAPHGEPEGL